MLSFLKKSPDRFHASSDTILVQKSIAGNNLAFEALVIRYQRLVYTIALSGCGNFALSEDITQDTFIQAWKKIDTLKDPKLFKSWLCTITRRITSRLQSKNTVIDDTTTPELIDNAKTPAQSSSSSDDIALVQQTIAKLPELYREPLVLHYSQHLSVKEIATLLEVSEDAVKQRLARGRKHLKSHIENTVENVLLVSQPSSALATSVSAAILATQSKTVAATAATSSGFFSMVSGLGLFGFINALFLKVSMNSTRSPDELKLYKQHLKTNFLILILGIAVSLGPALLYICLSKELEHINYVLIYTFISNIPFSAVIMLRHNRVSKEMDSLRQKEQTNYPDLPLIAPSANAPVKRALLYGLLTAILIFPVSALCLVGEYWIILTAYLSCILEAAVLGYCLGNRPQPKKELYHFQVFISIIGSFTPLFIFYYPPIRETSFNYFSDSLYVISHPSVATILLMMMIITFITQRTKIAAKKQAHLRPEKDNE